MQRSENECAFSCCSSRPCSLTTCFFPRDATCPAAISCERRGSVPVAFDGSADPWIKFDGSSEPCYLAFLREFVLLSLHGTSL